MTEYLYLNPNTHKWERSTPAATTREAAAREAFLHHPHYLRVWTCPVLTVRDGICIPDHNSEVFYSFDDNGRLRADGTTLDMARVR